MIAIKQRQKRVTINTVCIEMVCECGGICVNDRGSYIIEHTDVNVQCEDCGERYPVPSKPFTRKEKKIRTNETEASK